MRSALACTEKATGRPCWKLTVLEGSRILRGKTLSVDKANACIRLRWKRLKAWSNEDADIEDDEAESEEEDEGSHAAQCKGRRNWTAEEDEELVVPARTQLVNHLGKLQHPSGAI